MVSTKMQKTIVVQVSAARAASAVSPHRDEAQEILRARRSRATARVGDVVRIIECRPLSKLKRWRLGEVVRRSALVGAAQPSDLDVKI